MFPPAVTWLSAAVGAVGVANFGSASVPRGAKRFPAAGQHAQGVTASQRGGDLLPGVSHALLRLWL